MSAFLRITSCLLLLGRAAASAQESSPLKEPLPKPPLIASAPANSQWTITYIMNTPEKKKPTGEELRNRKMRQQYSPLVLSKRVLKAPGQMVIYTTYEAGQKSEAWVVGKYLYTLPMREGQGTQIEPRAPGDFPEISWVTAANFRGTVKLRKRALQLYQTEAASPHQSPLPVAQSHPEKSPASDKISLRRAYIDPETHLPVVVDIGTSTLTYEFSEPSVAFPLMDPRISPQPKSAQE